MEQADEVKVPALFDHCLTVYAAMEDRSSLEPILSLNGQEGLVYEGFLTHLVREEAHLSLPYYTKVTGKLKAMACIEQLRRGGSTAPSKWLLLQAPTLDLFHNSAESPNKAYTSSKLDILEQRIMDLDERLRKAGI